MTAAGGTIEEESSRRAGRAGAGRAVPWTRRRRRARQDVAELSGSPEETRKRGSAAGILANWRYYCRLAGQPEDAASPRAAYSPCIPARPC